MNDLAVVLSNENCMIIVKINIKKKMSYQNCL